jgi:hypothetical protein
MRYVSKTAYELVTGFKPTNKEDRQKLNNRKRVKINWTKKRKNER